LFHDLTAVYLPRYYFLIDRLAEVWSEKIVQDDSCPRSFSGQCQLSCSPKDDTLKETHCQTEVVESDQVQINSLQGMCVNSKKKIGAMKKPIVIQKKILCAGVEKKPKTKL
jgi:hypothetical protein